jgi:hypothetical protein
MMRLIDRSRRRLIALAAIASLASLASLASAADAPLLVPGGALDPGQRPRDVYLAAPVAAVPDRATACRVAERYIQLIDAERFADLPSLYAEDAQVFSPTQEIARGRKALAAFYARVGTLKPHLIGVAYVGTRSECMVEFAVRAQIDGKPRYVLGVIDHFTLNKAGLVTRMIAFGRGPNPNFLLTEHK